ncbi:MAG: tol-pal system protein YbgF [Thiobacillaceae bacterium]|jgi:tol-pal system protein YbgF|nr:tol-pal system protein YbgF [Thiobacillaceae bacterium]
MQRLWLIVLLLGLVQPASANTEELTRQLRELQQATRVLDSRIQKLESSLQQNQQMLGLLQEVEAIKAEVAKLRGQAEVQLHQMDTLGKRQNDLYVDLDQRLADLNKSLSPPAAVPVVAVAQPPSAEAARPAPVSTGKEESPQAGTAQTSQSSPAPAAVAAAPQAKAQAVQAAPQLDPLLESRTYEAALNNFRAGNYAGAIAGFKGFLKAYPDSALASNAQYWVGYSYYVLKDYKTALAQQQKLLLAYPDSAKVPDALFNIAANQISLDDLASARNTLSELVAKYPGTHAATLAARRLAVLN